MYTQLKSVAAADLRLLNTSVSSVQKKVSTIWKNNVGKAVLRTACHDTKPFTMSILHSTPRIYKQEKNDQHEDLVENIRTIYETIIVYRPDKYDY